MLDWKTLNRDVIAEFRANGGRVARFGDLPLVILHTLAADTGTLREVPLIVVPDGARQLLFGTAAGAPEHPRWVHDLKAHPRITVELGTERFTADVLELSPAESAQQVRDQAAGSAQFKKYQESAAPRAIPVFAIQRV